MFQRLRFVERYMNPVLIVSEPDKTERSGEDRLVRNSNGRVCRHQQEVSVWYRAPCRGVLSVRCRVVEGLISRAKREKPNAMVLLRKAAICFNCVIVSPQIPASAARQPQLPPTCFGNSLNACWIYTHDVVSDTVIVELGKFRTLHADGMSCLILSKMTTGSLGRCT